MFHHRQHSLLAPDAVARTNVSRNTRTRFLHVVCSYNPTSPCTVYNINAEAVGIVGSFRVRNLGL